MSNRIDTLRQVAVEAVPVEVAVCAEVAPAEEAQEEVAQVAETTEVE